MIIFVGFKNGVDWSDGGKYFSTIGDTKEQVINQLLINTSDVKQKTKYKRDLLEGIGEISAYFSIESYDSQTGEKLS